MSVTQTLFGSATSNVYGIRVGSVSCALVSVDKPVLLQVPKWIGASLLSSWLR